MVTIMKITINTTDGLSINSQVGAVESYLIHVGVPKSEDIHAKNVYYNGWKRIQASRTKTGISFNVRRVI